MSSNGCGKRQRSGETFTLCSSVIDDTWDDIFKDLLEESEFKIHKTDTVSVTISDKLMGTTVFTPENVKSTN